MSFEDNHFGGLHACCLMILDVEAGCLHEKHT